MKLLDLPFTVTDWSKLVPVEHKGERGTSYWRTFTIGELRVRLVEYSPGYLADHWSRAEGPQGSSCGTNPETTRTQGLLPFDQSGI